MHEVPAPSTSTRTACVQICFVVYCVNVIYFLISRTTTLRSKVPCWRDRSTKVDERIGLQKLKRYVVRFALTDFGRSMYVQKCTMHYTVIYRGCQFRLASEREPVCQA